MAISSAASIDGSLDKIEGNYQRFCAAANNPVLTLLQSKLEQLKQDFEEFRFITERDEARWQEVRSAKYDIKKQLSGPTPGPITPGPITPAAYKPTPVKPTPVKPASVKPSAPPAPSKPATSKPSVVIKQEPGLEDNA
jgi:hypothetical protein